MSRTQQCSFSMRFKKNVDVIISTPNSLNVNILYLCGQGYVGAGSTSGQLKGLNAIK